MSSRIEEAINVTFTLTPVSPMKNSRETRTLLKDRHDKHIRFLRPHFPVLVAYQVSHVYRNFEREKLRKSATDGPEFAREKDGGCEQSNRGEYGNSGARES